MGIFLQAGKFADLVLWEPALFGAKPAMILKGGQVKPLFFTKELFLGTTLLFLF